MQNDLKIKFIQRLKAADSAMLSNKGANEDPERHVLRAL